MTHGEIADYLQVGGLLIGGVVALVTYSSDARLRRSEWIYRLYAQFYENDRFKDIRRLIDYAPEAEIQQLAYEAASEQASDRHEALVDYLNFFEFIAVQLKNKNIRRSEMLDMFEYYLSRMKGHSFIVEYLEKYGYENLSELLKTLD